MCVCVCIPLVLRKSQSSVWFFDTICLKTHGFEKKLHISINVLLISPFLSLSSPNWYKILLNSLYSCLGKI